MYNVKDFLEDIDRINASIGHDKEREKLRDRIFSCAVLSESVFPVMTLQLLQQNFVLYDIHLQSYCSSESIYLL